MYGVLSLIDRYTRRRITLADIKAPVEFVIVTLLVLELYVTDILLAVISGTTLFATSTKPKYEAIPERPPIMTVP